MNHKTHTYKGRGALANPAGRFEKTDREPFDDGWGSLEMLELPALKTTVQPDKSKSILNRNQSPDIPFDVSINPYKGCEHGCIYCYARQTHAYLGLSPGLDFESKIFKKTEVRRHLERAFRKRGYEVDAIAIGANTDPYQPVERQERVTRAILEVMAEYRHPLSIVTKSALVLRDLDILAPMAEQGLVMVYLSITSLQPKLARILEPRAAAPHRRLATIRRLREAGVPVGVMAAPMIPRINDDELEAILEAAKAAGAEAAGMILLRLPHEVRDLFWDWLVHHFPDRAEHVMSLLRQMRGGKDYEATYGTRMRGRGPYATLLAQRYRLAIRRFGLNRSRRELCKDHFRIPPRPGDQLALFGQDV